MGQRRLNHPHAPMTVAQRQAIVRLRRATGAYLTIDWTDATMAEARGIIFGLLSQLKENQSKGTSNVS